MKLTRVLHPEIVQGKRGPTKLIKTYRDFFAKMNLGKGQFISSSHIERILYQSAKVQFDLAYKAQHGCKTFYIGREFAEALKHCSGAIPIDLLPKSFFAHIAFPENCIFDADGDEATGCYVFIGNGKEAGLAPEHWEEPAVTMCYLLKSLNSELPPESGYFADTLTEFKNTGHLISNLTPITESGDEDSEGRVHDSIWRFIFNVVLYIHSPYSDQFPLRTREVLNSKDFKSQSEKSSVENLCSIPVILISWNYQRPISYSKDSTTVQSHLRWQRCGPENSASKLILIREHLRSFINHS